MGRRERRLARLAAAEAHMAKQLPVPVDLTPTPKVQSTAKSKPVWLSSSSSLRTTTPLFPLAAPPQPKVFYTQKAWAKIQYLIQQAKGEVGWVGLVDRKGYDFLITEVWVPKQIVTGTTTKIDAQAINAIVTDLIMQDRYNDNLLYWGHSHVNMSCSPSVVDEEQIQDYVELMSDTGLYIRGIYNKKGESKVDVYVKEGPGKGWVFQCVENQVLCELSEDELNALAADFRNNVKAAPPVRVPAKPSTGNYPVRYREGMSSRGTFTTLLGPNDYNRYGRPATDDLLADLEDGRVSYDDLTDGDAFLKAGME
jgi:hypothetical protein